MLEKKKKRKQSSFQRERGRDQKEGNVQYDADDVPRATHDAMDAEAV